MSNVFHVHVHTCIANKSQTHIYLEELVEQFFRNLVFCVVMNECLLQGMKTLQTYCDLETFLTKKPLQFDKLIILTYRYLDACDSQ